MEQTLDRPTVKTVVMEGVLDANDALAQANRALFDAAGAYVVNVMSSPGSGKTTLLERTLERLKDRVRIGVLEGDVQTSLDADRLARFGGPVVQINTQGGFGGSCHLDANMVRVGMRQLPLNDIDLLFVENVGNLVCPAAFRLGENVNVVVASVAEGEDKPLKYPVMFRAVELAVVNKIDLLPYLDFDLEQFERNIRAVNPDVKILRVSSKTGEGIDAWLEWLTSRLPSTLVAA